ncbi:hypothetical protein BAU15_05045 [Enterococcus sp. JM4C]|nr:hypothetical protein BAU15_05045 [Enterococcus sp. JM4C]
MVKRSLGMGIGLLAVGFLLAGCGSAKKEVTLWNPFTGKDGEYFQKIVDSYNETDPEYTIKNVTVPEMYTKINTVMNSKKDKDVPDLTVMHVERVELFQSQGVIDPMTDVIKGQKNLNEDNYIAQAWDSGEVDGTRYTIPLDVHSSPVFYNKDLLEKYGPNVLDDEVITVQEIEEVTEKAKKDNIITYPVNLESWTSLSFTTELGGSIEKDGMPNLNTPEMKKAIETWKHFVDIGACQEDGDDPVQLFQSGQAVFFQDGTWGIAGHKEIKDLNWGITNTPAFSPDKISNWTSSHQFGLLKKERSPEVIEAIGAFLEHVRKNSEIWAESGQNPASRVIFEDEGYSKYPQSYLVSNEKELDSLKIYNFKNNGITLDALGTYVRDMIYGRIEIDKGLEDAQKQAEDKLKEGI